MYKLYFLLLTLCVIHTASAQSDPVWQQKISPQLLAQTRDGQATSFLIILKEQADISGAYELQSKAEKGTYVLQLLQETAQSSQPALISFLMKQNVAYESLFIINAIRAKGNNALIQQLAQRHDVSQLTSDAPVTFAAPVEMHEATPSTRSTITWGIEKINADDVWALGYRGQGVVVGGEDTGYQWNHESLIKQYRGYNEVAGGTVDHNYNWHDAIHEISPLSNDTINPCGLDVREPCDDFGHGTHTMGTMIGLDSTNEIGVAPEARWCGCRNMEQGNGSPFTYIECFQWFLAPTNLDNQNPDPSLAPHVINNSWGCPENEGCDSSNWYLMNEVVNTLRAAGIVVVVSAGNDGPGCSTINSPASMFEGSFTIGATAINDSIIGFSSRGPVAVDSSFRTKPNVSAPGVGVLSARLGGGYRFSSGTSMAGPHVAGTVALMISANPLLAGKVDVIEDILEQTAVHKTTDQQCGDIPGTEIPNNTYGYGRIDALAAVEAALAYDPTGIHEPNQTLQLIIYPNPVTNQLMIETKRATGELQMQVFDLQGRIVMFKNMMLSGEPVHKIDFSAIPTGFYFYQLAMSGKTQVGKLVKQ